ncbi:MAG: hypothetical protein K0S94_2506, partial [Nitrospira sp.]|nr:hypothetical protein [Nitrospira sp.]
PASLSVDEAAEYGGGIESWQTEPHDAAVAPDQCRRRTISDDAVIFDWQIAVDAIKGPQLPYPPRRKLVVSFIHSFLPK